MRTPVTRALALLISAAPALAAAADNLDSKLDTSFKFVPGIVYQSLELDIANRSSRAVCVDADFDAAGKLQIWHANGEAISPVRPYGLPDMRSVHGFYYKFSYDIVLPRTTLTVFLDLNYYKLTPGQYKFEYHIPYYVCDDIVSLEKASAPTQDIVLWDLDRKGSFLVPKLER